MITRPLLSIAAQGQFDRSLGFRGHPNLITDLRANTYVTDLRQAAMETKGWGHRL